jgi:hypothetical protein
LHEDELALEDHLIRRIHLCPYGAIHGPMDST